MVRQWRLLALAVAMVLAGCTGRSEGPEAAGPGSRQAWERLVAASREPQNWLVHGGTTAEQRYSALDQINTANVGTLGLAWWFDLDTSRGQEATPLVVDEVLYTTTAWSKVVALEAATGKPLWRYDPKVPGDAAYKGCCDVVNRGAAYFDSKLFLGTLDGRLVALDAKTGRALWSTVTVDQSQPYTITGAPRIVKGLVVIGNSGADLGVRGYVSAYDAATGKLVWRFYTVPGDPAKGPDGAASDPVMQQAAATWSGRFWSGGGGGTVWDSIVYDAELDQLLIGVGNGSPWNHEIRSQGKGDNLFTSSIVALDPNTGRYKWHYQQTPGETWDFTATQQMMLATLPIGGQPRKVLMQAPKNGFFYVLDRTNGKLLSAEKYVPANWASKIDIATGRPVEAPGARYVDKPFLMSIGGAGGHNWQPMSFSPRTGLVYIPAQELPMMYIADKSYKLGSGSFTNGIDVNFAEIPASPAARQQIAGTLKGRLLAWNPVTQKPAWSVEYGGPWNGGTLATGGDLVFQGSARGEFIAYDARNGRRLWRFDAQTGVMAGPVSFAVGGTQYVAVMAGYGGAVGLALPEFGKVKPQPLGRVLVFRLGGRGALPANAAVPAPANPPSETWAPQVEARGAALYAIQCSRCHALGNLSAGVVPDLRRSGALSDGAVWRQVVIDGVLSERGMVSFAKLLSPDDAEAIRAYVAKNARALKAEEGGNGRR